jgi:hypothetical protein
VDRRWLRVALAVLALAVAGVALALLAAALVGGYHATRAQDAANAVRSGVEAEETAATIAALEDLQEHSAGVGRWLGGAPWTWLTGLPVLGEAIGVASELAESLDAVVTPLAEGAVEVLDASAEDPAQVARALHEQSARFVTAGREAVQRSADIAAVDVAALPSPVREEIAEAQQQFDELTAVATAAAAGSVVLPGLLGIQDRTPWLLVASQPAEARGSGAGFFGAVAAMEGNDGAARLTAVHPNDEFFDVAADLGQLPAEFADLWGESAAYVWAHNLTRHFPYSAALLRSSAASVTEPAQYVVAVDPSVVAALLSITGPVTAAGVTIDSGSAVRYLTQDIYRDFPVGAQKDEVVSQLLAAAFDAFQAADATAVEIAAALAAPIAEQRLVAWASDPQEQEVLEWTPLAGGVPEPDWTLTAAINNAGGNKLDAYLATAVVMTVQGDCRTVTGAELTVTLSLEALPPGLPGYVTAGVRGPGGYGGTRLLVHLYGPPGAELGTLTVDGRAAVPQRGTELGRPVWGATVDLIPGQDRTVSAVFDGQWPRQPADFVAQPMVRPTTVRIEDPGSCLSDVG